MHKMQDAIKTSQRKGSRWSRLYKDVLKAKRKYITAGQKQDGLASERRHFTKGQEKPRSTKPEQQDQRESSSERPALKRPQACKAESQTRNNTKRSCNKQICEEKTTRRRRQPRRQGRKDNQNSRQQQRLSNTCRTVR